MSELQKAWARGRLGLSAEGYPFPDEAAETDVEQEQADVLPELPERSDDDSSSASSASSASSTGTIVPSPSQKLFARPTGCVLCSFLLVIRLHWSQWRKEVRQTPFQYPLVV